MTVTLTYPSSSGTKELSINTADKASNTQATYDSVEKEYTCTFDEIIDFAADSTSVTDYKSFKIEVTDSITPVLTSGEKTLQILYNNIDKVKPEASFYPINADVKTAIASTTDYTTSLDAAISKVGGESLFRYYGNQNGYNTKNLVSGHVEPRNGMPSGTNNSALSGVVILRGTVSDNQRIAKVKLLLNGTEESAVTILEWNTTEKKMVPTTGTNAIALNEKLDQEGHSFEWAYAWDTTTVTETGVGGNLPIRVIAEDFSTINTETVKGPLKSERIDYTNSESTYNAENVDVVPYISSIKTSLFNRSTQNPTVYTRTALGKYPVRAGETIILNGFNFGNSPEVTIDSTKHTTSGSEKNATTSAYSVPVEIVNTAKSSALTLSNGSISTNNNNNDNELTVNQQPNNANNNLLTDDVELDIWEFKNIAIPAVSAFKSPNVKISPKDGTIGASFSNFLFFNMAGKRGEDNKIYTQTPYQLAYNGCDANTFAFDSNGWTYGAVQYQTNNSQGISGYFQFFTGTANKVSEMFLDGVYWNVKGATRLEANALNLREDQTKNKSNWMTNLYRITSPVIIPVVTDETAEIAGNIETAVKVHIAYCDTTTHQIRYRNGKVYPTTTGAAIYDASGSLKDVANLTGKQGNSRPECPSDSIRTTVGQRVHIVANSGASLPGAETVASVYSDTTTYGAGEYVDMGILKNNSTVVLAWHDSESNRLIFTYNENPDDGTQDSTYKSLAKGTGATAWQTNAKVIDTDSGAFVRLAVDSDDGIHIAYYSDSTSSLKYAYLSSYDATPVISTIDSYLEVGKNITLNVAKTGDNQVPYIGYYANSLAKEAYRVNFEAGNNAGVNEDEYFTRNWEVSFVPTSETVIDDTVNIGVYRDTGGALQAIPGQGKVDVSETNGTAENNVPGDSSRVYANGTMNPIVAYINKSGALEMAQKK